ncbi:MAG: MBL fold metallo-hydrolase, partial [Clostridia bacterium]|nr:MBL fold metallo-hydrolase [Clostridia bacterium]
MIDTVVLAVGDLQVNCYIVAIHGGNECVVIDPGADAKRIKKTMDELGLKCAAILLTHGHFDHIGAARELGDDNVNVYVHNA